MSHSVFIIFDIISSPRFLSFDIVSHSTFSTRTSTLFPINVFYFSTLSLVRRLLPLFLCPSAIIYHSTFCPFNVFTVRHFFNQPFFQFDNLSVDVFYRQRFLLQHFVGESFVHVIFFSHPVSFF
jgi:hypothetical protein